MGPPANRRSGHSRRAQYSTFFGYLAGVVGAVAGVGLLIISITNPQFFADLRTTAADTVEPVGGAAARTRSAGHDVFAVLEGYALAGSRYDKMRRELDLAKVKLVEAKAIKAENMRLKKLLGLAQQDPKPVTVTRLTSSTAASSRRMASIGAGRADGVAAGMPVRSELGLVGRVLETGISSSRVLLVTDTESLVPVRRAGDDVAAFAQGRGDGTIQIKLIDLGINPLKKNDVFVTSGAGGLYRPGIAVAVVTQITPDGAVARVLSDPAATNFVVIDPVNVPEPVKAKLPAAEPEAP